jgi:hypothetical protein
MNVKRSLCCGCVSVLVLGAGWATGAEGDSPVWSGSLGERALTMSMASAYAAAEPATPPASAPASVDPAASGPAAATTEPGYGRAGTNWLTIGGLCATDFGNDTDLNLHIAWSRFIVDEVEFVLEGAVWYFNQEGQDTGGVSGSFLFRWHVLHAEDHKWTVFADVGIGLLGGFDEVPDGGTGCNFLPRAGAGFTRAFNDTVDGESHGPRWEVGVRWHHISNGRIEGDERNPARDSLAFYAGIVIPF